MNVGGIFKEIQGGKYVIWKKISDVWRSPPSDVQLHVYVTLPADMGSPIFSDTTGESYVSLPPAQDI